MGVFETIVGRTPWRGFGAWLLACYTSGVLILSGFIAPSFAYFEPAERILHLLFSVPATLVLGVFVGMFVASLTLMPMAVCVALIRVLRWPRPFADIALGAAMGGGIVQFFGSPASLIPAGVHWTAGLAVTGFIAGYAYWVAAGRPQAKEV